MRRLALLVLACLASTGAGPFPPITGVTELFPVEPGVNAERGFAVAVAGDWLALGARLDDEAGEDAGAVYLFQWSGTAWEQKSKLFADPPQAKGQFGLSVALRGDILAVGAPGESAVYVFQEGPSPSSEATGVWVQRARWPDAGPGPIDGLGRAVALGDGALAVGAGDGHGEAAGAVYVLRGPGWGLEQTILPQQAQAGERFGSAVSLAGDTLVVGAPGNDLGPQGVDAGAAFVFERLSGVWRQSSLLRAQYSGSQLSWDPAASQFGFAVATDGLQIVVGSPTADASGESSGAAFRFERGVGGWIGRGFLEGDVQPGDQFGFSVAVSPRLIAVGSPAPPRAAGAEALSAPAVPGSVRVFRRSGTSYSEVTRTPRNAEIRDLGGFAVAVDDNWVVTGAALGDQGSVAAGAAWSFLCPVSGNCGKEIEVVVRDPGTGPRFGHSIALTELPAAAESPSALIAVGAPTDRGDFVGHVYVFRRAGKGWRQEAILRSLFPGDGFGASVALAGPLLAVGAPAGGPDPVSPSSNLPSGVVHLFARSSTGSWSYETSLMATDPEPGDGFGTSVSFGDGVLAVGAPAGDEGGVVYVFEKRDQGWIYSATVQPPDRNPDDGFGDGFGSAVSVFGKLLAIGAPGTDGGAGAVYASRPGSMAWTNLQRLPGGATADERLGTSVAAGDGTIVAGAPGFYGGSGHLHVFGIQVISRRTLWVFKQFVPDDLMPDDPTLHLGGSVALSRDRLIVGAKGEVSIDRGDTDEAFLYERCNGLWALVEGVDAVAAPRGDEFGTAVALSPRFFVVTSPGPVRSPRFTLFDLDAPETAHCTP